MKSVLLILLGIPYMGMAQSSSKPHFNIGDGIHFEQGLSWEQIKAKARAEDKYIFMDCYATWCSPCKWMSENIFPLHDVGDYMNSHFISVAVQMDKTNKDRDEIKKWYAQARAIDSQFSIIELPTYLFFSPDGTPVHRIIGVTGSDGKSFLAKVGDALNPDKQYYNQIDAFRQHIKDTASLRTALITALSKADPINAEAIEENYIRAIADPFTKENLILIQKSIYSTGDSGFHFLLKNALKADSILANPGSSEWALSDIICKERVTPLFDRKHSISDCDQLLVHLDEEFPTLKAMFTNQAKYVLYVGICKEDLDPFFPPSESSPYYVNKITSDLAVKYPTLGEDLAQAAAVRLKSLVANYVRGEVSHLDTPINWRQFSKNMARKFPDGGTSRVVAEAEMNYYKRKNNVRKFEQSTARYMLTYYNELSSNQINNVAWVVFETSQNIRLLKRALEWSKVAISGYPDKGDPINIDTYANLLYKTGNQSDAILWEQRSIEMMKKEPTVYSSIIVTEESNLSKMSAGQKTW